MSNHPADGLYYVTLDMLYRAKACSAARDVLFPDAASEQTRQPLTYEAMRLICIRTTIADWTERHLYLGGRVTRKELDDFLIGYCRPGYTSEARAFMDMLYARAKREGLIHG